MTYYNSDLSYIHHHGYSDVAINAAKVILELIETKTKPCKIVDLGCGSGTTARILSEAGHEVLGVDYSEHMVELARKNVPMATFETGSLFDYQIPDCDVVSAIGEPLNYLFDDNNNLDRIGALFTSIYQHLSSKGYFVFDLLTPGTLDQENPVKKIIEQEDWTLFLQIEEDTLSNILTREITIFRKHGARYIKSKEVHRQCLYDRNKIQRLLQNTGFKVRETKHYGQLELRPGHFAYLCQKV